MASFRAKHPIIRWKAFEKGFLPAGSERVYHPVLFGKDASNSFHEVFLSATEPFHYIENGKRKFTLPECSEVEWERAALGLPKLRSEKFVDKLLLNNDESCLKFSGCIINSKMELVVEARDDKSARNLLKDISKKDDFAAKNLLDDFSKKRNLIKLLVNAVTSNWRDRSVLIEQAQKVMPELNLNQATDLIDQVFVSAQAEVCSCPPDEDE